MRLDHLSYAAGPDGARAAAGELGRLLGSSSSTAGSTPGSAPGTSRSRWPADGTSRWSSAGSSGGGQGGVGQVVRARSAEGGGWLGWVVAIEDITEVETRMVGRRSRGTGTSRTGRCWSGGSGVRGLQSDPQLPFFVQWRSDAAIHPSVGGGQVDLLAVEIAGSQTRVEDWLGGSANHALADIPIDGVAPRGQPGLIAATFGTPTGSYGSSEPRSPPDRPGFRPRTAAPSRRSPGQLAHRQGGAPGGCRMPEPKPTGSRDALGALA